MRLSLATVAFSLLSFTQSAAVKPRSFTFQRNSCSPDRQEIIKTEIENARLIAEYNAGILDATNPFYETFFSKEQREDAEFLEKVRSVYQKIAETLASDGGENFNIICNNAKTGCATKNWVGSWNDGTNTMNFCDRFFTNTPPPGNAEKAIKSTEERLSQCQNPDTQEWFNLRHGHWSRASIVLHESTHMSRSFVDTGYTEGGTRDYAYGVNGCLALAGGTYDRACLNEKHENPILCPQENDPSKEGVCQHTDAFINADTYAIIGAGNWFSLECGYELPMPPPATRAVNGTAVSGADSGNYLAPRYYCYEDEIVIDTPVS